MAIVARHAHPSNQPLIDREFAEDGADLVIQAYVIVRFS